MKSFWVISIAAMVIQPAYSSDDAGGVNKVPAAAAAVPKVLRSFEPEESRFVRLPGPPLPKPAVVAPTPRAKVLVAPGWRPSGVPVLPVAPEVVLAIPDASLDDLQPIFADAPEPATLLAPVTEFQPIGPPPLPSEAVLTADPLSESPELESIPENKPELPSLPQEPRRPVFPAGFAQESAVFCQRQIGHWSLAEARVVFGEPRRSRAAIGDDSNENGRIYAFRDPTNRYRELELDFDKDKGILRTVFVYPWNLTWQDCRKLWGSNVSSAEGSKGRVFYSYVNRHLDVLVDHDGKVISLGLY